MALANHARDILKEKIFLFGMSSLVTVPGIVTLAGRTEYVNLASCHRVTGAGELHPYQVKNV